MSKRPFEPVPKDGSVVQPAAGAGVVWIDFEMACFACFGLLCLGLLAWRLSRQIHAAQRRLVQARNISFNVLHGRQMFDDLSEQDKQLVEAFHSSKLQKEVDELRSRRQTQSYRGFALLFLFCFSLLFFS